MKSEHETVVYRLAQILIKLNQGLRVDPRQLSEEFGVNLRTIQRDLNQRFSYLPLIKKDGLYQLEEYALGKFSDKDINRFASLAGVMGLFPSLNTDFLRQVFDAHAANVVLVRGHNYEDISGRGNEFKLLEAAIRQSVQVTFDYTSKGQVSRRTALPYRLINHKGIWYLAAVEMETMKTFAFTCIANIDATSTAFVPDPKMIERLESDESICMSATTTEVILKVAPAVADYFKRRKVIPNQVIEKELQDGGLLVSVPVGQVDQILPIVRYWIPHLRIVSPDRMQDVLMAQLSAYAEQGYSK